ncbi:MAG: L-seryl-tRNA(Sec) kinase [Candidatus Methanofastidiosum methylothiophilum]|uniref:L-seryl-tRNA(Sec) kinase n=1 Tax=Candidatus Methanofastidiosum methylothiophilum TaxID=1705564 RepID=A0A150J0A4_9EURY|nr:MAG: L-seryl-tRNA(Sec) kinase [Candidatus Methanofastidiosum methylthiophilus]
MLIVITGLPGSGKTTIADALSKEIDAVVLSTDKIRKSMFKNPIYNEEDKRIIYNELFSQGKNLLSAGRSVILDGTFYTRALRERAKEIANATNEKIFFVYCETPESILKERITKRKDKYSDADFSVYLKIKEIFEDFEEEVISIDTSKNLNKNVRVILKKIQSI